MMTNKKPVKLSLPPVEQFMDEAKLEKFTLAVMYTQVMNGRKLSYEQSGDFLALLAKHGDPTEESLDEAALFVEVITK